MDYSTLVNAIKAYTENTFPLTPSSGGLDDTQQLSTFVQQAEERIYNAVQTLVTRKQDDILCVASTATVATPSDWMSPYALAVVVAGDRSYLLNKESTFIRESFSSPATTGVPQFYAMQDDDLILLGPTPDSGYTIEADYYYYPLSIVAADTTWLGDNFSSVLLYGSLLEAFTFMQAEVDVLEQVQKRYDEALALLKQYAEGKTRQDNYRTPPVRYPVR
jgi:hypothetical protein